MENLLWSVAARGAMNYFHVDLDTIYSAPFVLSLWERAFNRTAQCDNSIRKKSTRGEKERERERERERESGRKEQEAAALLTIKRWSKSPLVTSVFTRHVVFPKLESTGRMGWMAHRKWKEMKQQPSMLHGPAVPGSCLASFHFRWAIHPIRPVQCGPGAPDVRSWFCPKNIDLTSGLTLHQSYKRV